MFQKLSLLVVFIFLLTACLSPSGGAAPVQQTSEASSPPPTESPAPAPTETLAPTATPTPEPTTTPEPEPVVVQTEVTFDLTNGEKLTMPAFILNYPSEDPAILERQQIEVLEATLQYIVTKGVAWGYDGKDHTNEVSREDYEFVFSLPKLVDQPEFVATNFRLPQAQNIDDNDTFIISNIIKINDMYIFIYKNGNENESKRYEAVSVKIFSPTISNLLQKVNVPQKP